MRACRSKIFYKKQKCATARSGIACNRGRSIVTPRDARTQQKNQSCGVARACPLLRETRKIPYNIRENNVTENRPLLHDHFGLDTLDLSEEKFLNMKAGYFPAFRQWYILQHWNGLGYTSQPKPFVTIVSFAVGFSGTC